jgi:hypothetical protein
MLKKKPCTIRISGALVSIVNTCSLMSTETCGIILAKMIFSVLNKRVRFSLVPAPCVEMCVMCIKLAMKMARQLHPITPCNRI